MTIRDSKTFVPSDRIERWVLFGRIVDFFFGLLPIIAVVAAGITVVIMIVGANNARYTELVEKCISVGGTEVLADADDNKVCITGRKDISTK